MERNKEERRKWDYIAVIAIRQNIAKPIFIRLLDYKLKKENAFSFAFACCQFIPCV